MTPEQAQALRNERRQAVVAAVERGDAKAVARAVRTLASAGLTAADAGFVERTIKPAKLRAVRTFVARSVTIEPALPFLAAHAAGHGLALDFTVGGYGSYQTELLGGTAGPVAGADLVLIVLELADVAGEPLARRFATLAPGDIAAAVDDATAQLGSLLTGARTAAPRAKILMQDFALPAWPALGVVADGQRGATSETAALRALNGRLRELAARVGDCVIVDHDALVAARGRATFRDPRMWFMGRIPIAGAHQDAWGRWVARHLRPLFVPPRKVLVLDLDNTLWGGVVGEDGVQGIKTGSDFPGSCHLELQREARRLSDRGVILALCSKNNPGDVEEAFKQRKDDLALGLEDFAAVRITWNPKPAMLLELADELQVGIDSFVFVDDSAHECAAVREALPDVEVVELPKDPLQIPGIIASLDSFEQLVLTDEDKQRGRMYKAERTRKEMAATATSPEDFLRSLEIVVTVLGVEQAGAARIAQLTQKTNQFNVTTRRYSEGDVRRLAAEPGTDVLAVRVRDRLGDSGVVGVVIARYGSETAEVDSFMLSCRVIGRGIEGALLALLGRRARAAGARVLTGEFIPTAKNAPARDFFAKHGFTDVGEGAAGAGHRLYRYDLTAGEPPAPSYITLEVPA